MHAARSPDHIPSQPDSGECRGALQLQGRGGQGPEVPAHVSFIKTALLTYKVSKNRSVTAIGLKQQEEGWNCDWRGCTFP